MIIKLKKLGLSPYEAKCYVTLVKYSSLSGKDIAKKSGVPPTSVYRNLESLQEKGFVSLLQKEPLIYQAVNPEIAITHYVNLKKVVLEEVEQGAIQELQTMKQVGVIEKEKEVLKIYGGRKQGYTIGKKLIETANKEFLLIGSASKQSILDIIHSLKKARKKNVICHYIVTMYNDNNKDLIEEVKALGVKIKYYPLQNFSMLIKDKEESLIALKQVKERIVLNIKDKDLSSAHRDYFNSIWRKATPV